MDLLPETLERAVLAGGSRLMRIFGRPVEDLKVEYKAADGDTPRTIIDRESEAAILAIKEESAFRDDGTNPEESKGKQGTTGRNWHIDPFDGTSNLLITSPNSTVGIAVSDGDELIAAAVLHPFARKLYSALKGQGAVSYDVGFDDFFYIKQKTRQPLRVSNRSAHKDLFVTTDSLLNKQTAKRKTGWLCDIGEQVAMNHRSTGSNVDYGARLAEGSTDITLTDAVGGYYDVAPCYVLITEAGGFYGNLEGKQPMPGDEITVGANSKELFERVLAITNKHYGKESPLGLYKGFR